MYSSRKARFAMLVAIAVACTAIACAVMACAPSEKNEPKQEAASSAKDAVVEVAWSSESDCSACHITQSASMDDTGCLLSQHADQECISCRSDEAALSEIHEKKAGSDPEKLKSLKSTEVSMTGCVECHGSWEELAEKTVDVTILTDTNGKTVNPHEAATVGNTTGQHDEITCTSCHEMHTSESIEETAPKACQTCHHMDVYECGTCHEVA